MGQGGGQSKPVSQGESARSSQPLGAIKNSSPTANAAWGVASRAGTGRSSRASVPSTQARRSKARLTHQASAVDASPVHRLKPSARNQVGSSPSARQASALNSAASAKPAVASKGRPAISASASGHNLRWSLMWWCDAVWP